MHRALVAGGFVLTVGAAVEPGVGILEKLAAFWAVSHIALGLAVVFAIDMYHGGDGLKLSQQLTT